MGDDAEGHDMLSYCCDVEAAAVVAHEDGAMGP